MDPALANWQKLAITVSPYQLAVWMEAKTIDASDINRMADTPAGSEALQLIVQGDLKGQATFVGDALWQRERASAAGAPRCFTNRMVPPVTSQQLKSVGKDPDCLYWSPTFRCWALSGDWIRPYATTHRQLAELGLEINPEA